MLTAEQSDIVRDDLASALSVIASVSRSIWKLSFLDAELSQTEETRSEQYVAAPLSALDGELGGFGSDLNADHATRVAAILKALVAAELASVSGEVVRIPKTASHPLRLTRDLLGDSFPDYQLQWLLMLAIRQHYRCVPSAQVVHLFRLLADRLNEIGELQSSKKQTLGPRRLSFAQTLSSLTSSLEYARIKRRLAPEAVDLFFEVCRAINYVQVDYSPGQIAIMATSVDAEYLLSRLFGLTTGIPGFDDLFGGGGMLLPDEFVPEPNEWSQSPVVGRSVIAAGRYATGKSLLALRIAVEVARKGGAAWFIPFEQSTDECLYALEAMSALPADGSVVVVRDILEIESHLRSPKPRSGLLILLRSIKDSLDTLLDLLPDYAKRLEQYPLRMLLLDPINAIVRLRKEENEERRRVLKVLEDVKNTRTNIWMNAEESPGAEPDRFFEQNIADIVLRLSVSEEFGYTQNYMEVTKSRLQRHQRGRNPYTIQSGRGLILSPSPVSFADRIRARRVRMDTRPQTFGIPDFNRILGPGLIKTGDIVALVGPGGTFKTHVGLLFLQATGRSRNVDGSKPTSSHDHQIRNLLIPARDSKVGIEAKLAGDFLEPQRRSFSRWGTLKVCSLPSGFVQPGEILQRIEREFLQARLDRRDIERVMVDNVPHWEMGCPFVKRDQTFADTLLKLFRSQGCITLLTCNPVGVGSDLQKAIIDAADCVIEFDSVQARGAARILVRIIKTRNMRHRRETFELLIGQNSVELSPDAELLRISANKDISTVSVRLFLHAENDIQRQYNQEICSSIESTLAPHVILDVQSRLDLKWLPGLGAVSSVDELQVLQLDEFQVCGLKDESGAPLLYRFRNSDWDHVAWSDFDPSLVRGIRKKGAGFIAVPFCENISVLAYHPDRIDGPIQAQSWRMLAQQVEHLENSTLPDGKSGETYSADRVVFDFPKVSSENFNCLFFEILESMQPAKTLEDVCSLEHWLQSPEALEAAVLMRRIGGRSHRLLQRTRREFSQTGPSVLSIELNPSACIWRTWYSTLIQLLSTFPPEEAAKVMVIPLPGDVTVGGEWFLGIPAHSAAPDVGLRLIRNLTTREAEFERMKRGVGLPTRPRLYEGTPDDAPLSESFRLKYSDFNRLLTNRFRRSAFLCYRDFSDILGTHLRAIIDLQSEDKSEINRLLKTAISKIRIIQSDSRCTGCQTKQRSPKQDLVQAHTR